MDTGSAGRLRSSMKKLKMKWEVLGDSWQDVVRTEFEENYLAEFEAELITTAKEMDQLAQTIQRALRACE